MERNHNSNQRSVAAPSSSQSTAAGVSSCYDDIYSNLGTDLDNVAAAAASSNLSWVVEEASDDEDVFPNFNSSPLPYEAFHHDNDVCYFSCFEDVLRCIRWQDDQAHNHERNCQNSENNHPSQTTNAFETIAGESSCNFRGKDIDEEDAVQSLPPSMCRGQIFEADNHEGNCQSSQCNRPSQMTDTSGTIVGESGSILPGKDIDEEDAVQSLPLSLRRHQIFEADNHEGNCQSSQSNHPSQMTYPIRTIAGESSSILPEKDIDEEDVVQSLPPSMCRYQIFEADNHEGNCQSSQSNHPSQTTYPFRRIAGEGSSILPEKDINEGVVQSSPVSMHRDEIFQADNHEGNCQGSQWNLHSQTMYPPGTIAGESSANFPDKDIDEDVLQSIRLSMRRVEIFQANNHEWACQSSQSNRPSQMTYPFATIAGESGSNFPEKDIDDEDAVQSFPLSMCRDEKLEPNNRKRKCLRFQSNCPSEMTKPVDNMLVPDSDGMVAGKSISNLPEKDINEQDALPDEKLEGNSNKRKCQRSQRSHPCEMVKTSEGNLVSNFEAKAFVVLQRKAFLKKMFRHVWSCQHIKRAIMEKATAIVGGGGHAGVFLQGKKIIDENRTLSQTGISHESWLDVIVEPKPSLALHCLCPHSCPLQLPCTIPQPPARYSPTPAVVHHGTSDTLPDPLLFNAGTFIRGVHDLVECQTNVIGKSTTTSMEVIPFPAMSEEAVDVIPMHRKTNSSKNVQRRKSEFFSISEVKEVVQAVEELGPGRWKKIKEQALEMPVTGHTWI